MITRFFSTSKPIHLVLVAIFSFFVFILSRMDRFNDAFSLVSLVQELALFLVLFVSISVLAFFVSKNNLTQRNSYKILFFALLLAIIPESITFNNQLLANLFILLALRRLFSLRSNLRIKKKLFDAAFWIAVAALFHFWSILFIALIFGSLLLFSIANLKHWIIPITGLLCVFLLVSCYYLIVDDSIVGLYGLIDAFNFDFSNYNDLSFIIRLTIVLSFSIWATFFYIKGLNDKPKPLRSSHVLVIHTLIIAVFVALLSPLKNGGEFVFLFAPLAIIMANFVEGLSERWFSEIYIWLLILTPFIQFFL